MPAQKRPAAADPIAERCLSLRGKPVAPLVAKVLYGVLPATERALCIMHLPTLMPDGRLPIPPLIMETVQMLYTASQQIRGARTSLTSHSTRTCYASWARPSCSG